MIKTKVLRSMRKTVLGLMLSACVLTTSGVALDNVAMAASEKKTTSSDTTKPKIDMPSSDEENVGSVSFAVTDHAKGSFALVDDESMNVRYGDKVYFYAKPDDGYGFSSVSVRCMKKNEDGKFIEDEDMSKSITLHYNDEVSGVYYFVMPECDIASIQLPTTEVESQLQSTKSVKSKVTDTQDYIVQHLDKKYVNVASDYKITNNNLIDAVYVKNILVDGTNFDLSKLTTDYYWSDKSNFGAYRGNSQTYMPLYDLDENSDYYVSFVNPAYDEKEIVSNDYCFAHNNNNGEVINDIVYDKDTGIAYIPKKYSHIGKSENDTILCDIQCEFLQVLKSDDASARIYVDADIKNVDGSDLIQSGYFTYDAAANTISIPLAEKLETSSQFDIDTLKVVVDGTDFDIGEESIVGYNNATSSVEIRVPATLVRYVSISITGTNEKLSKSSSNALSILADAMMPAVEVKAASSWKDIAPISGAVKFKDDKIPAEGTSLNFKGVSFNYNSGVTDDYNGTSAHYAYYFTGDYNTYYGVVKKGNKLDGSGLEKAAKYAKVKGSSEPNFALKFAKNKKSTNKVMQFKKHQKYICECVHTGATGGDSSDGKGTVYGVVVHKSSDTASDGTVTNYVWVSYGLDKSYHTQNCVGTVGYKYVEEPTPATLEVQKWIGTEFPTLPSGALNAAQAESVYNAITDYDKFDDSELMSNTVNYAWNATVKVVGDTDGDGKYDDYTKTKTLNKNGYADFGEVKIGDYKITETSLPHGTLACKAIILSNNGDFTSGVVGSAEKVTTVTVNSEDKSVDIFNQAAYGAIHLTKSSALPNLIAGNGAYSLAGAEFNIQGPYAANNTTQPLMNDVGGFVNDNYSTDASGSWTSGKLYSGWYHITETSPSAGMTLANDGWVYVGNTAIATAQYNVKEPVKYLSLRNLLDKIDKNNRTPVGDAKLYGIKFRISVYDVTKTSVDETVSNPSKGLLYTIDLETKVRADGTGYIELTNSSGCVTGTSKASGPDYDANGVMMFPISYIKLEEISSPNGYRILDSNIQTSSPAKKFDNALVFSVLDNGSATVQALSGVNNNGQTWGESPAFAGIKIHKYDWDRITRENAGHESDNDLNQGDAKLSGIKFKVYNISNREVYLENNPSKTYPACTENNLNEASVVATLVTDSKGEAQTPTTLPYGTYLIVESKENGDGNNMDSDDNCGYLVNSDFKFKAVLHPSEADNHKLYSTTELINSGSGIDMSKTQTEATLNAHKEIPIDKIKRGGIILQKVMKDCEDTTAKHDGYTGAKKYTNDTPIGEGDISLAGAEFTVFSISDEDVCVYNDTAGKSYKWAKSYRVSDLANAKFKDDGKGNYWYYDANGNKLESCMTIKTDAKGVAKSIVNALPYGTYVIRETKAPTGAHVNDDWNVTFKIRKHNSYVDLTKSFSNTVTSSSADKFTRTKDGYAPVLEVPFRGNVMVEKDDKEYGKSEANGGKDHGNNKNGTHLEGIEFTIKNKSTYPVYVDTDEDGILEEYASGADIYKIYTKWDKVRKKYVASTAPWDEKNQTFITNAAATYKDKDYSIDYKLPYGTYSIRETDTTDSYILEDKTEYTFAIRNSKQLQTKYVKGSTTNFADMIYYNSVVRGDFEFEKQIERKEDELSSVFVVTNQTTGERHVIVTDRNGEYRSDKDWTRHEYQTNYNDVLLEKIDKGEVIDMDKMVTNYKHSQTGNQSMTNEQISSALKEAGDGAFLERCGLWFSLGEDGSTSKPSTIRGVDYREHGALPYGMYTIREVRTTTNTNYDMIDWNVWIYNDNSENNNRVDCGTKENSGDEKIRIASRAKDVSTEKNIGLAYDKAVIEDEVSFEQLVVGNKYTLVGRLYDKTTETYIKNEDGTDYTVERELRPGYVDSEDEVWSEKEGDFTKGSCVQTFKFDASKYEGHTIVVYEVLYDNKDKMPIVAARHCDKNDTRQTIHYPKIRTENLSDTMKDHDNPTKGEVTLTDTITYTNLLPNKRYTVTGILMDKDAGDEAMDKDKNYIQAKTTFTPEEADGELKLTYKFDAEGFEGKTLVSFVTVNQGGDDVGLHANLEDESQSIHFPQIQTTALDKTTQMHESLAEDPVTIVDTVAYKNLLPGKAYIMTGTLMNKKTGEKLLDSDGNEITATAEFTPEFADGTVDIEFTFNGDTLAGTTTVAFETLTREDVELTTHTDIEDKDQTVHFPKIQTTATYGDDAVNEGKAVKNLKIVDTVYYENLTPGEEYEVTGILMDKDTKTPVVNIKDEKKSDSVSGSAVSGDKTDTTTQTAVTIKSTKKFVPEKEKGYLTVTFEFDGTDYAGHDLVVFENLYRNGFHVAAHEDYEDEGQTIHLPKIGTTLTDKNTHLHESTVAKEITLVDTVAYKNLQVGKKYVVTGVLYDKATGEKLLVDGKEVTATKEFTPEKKNGAVDIEFVFNSEALRGHTVVAFEDVYHDNLNVATHADIEDKDQSVAFPNIKTVATKSGTEEKIIYVNDKASITDVITYNNVIKDHTYKVIGTLMSKSSQKEVVDKDGKPITAETGFVATDDKGSVELTFEFDATKYGNDKIVCFDNLYVVDTTNVDKDGKATDVLLLEDKDFENEDETITIPKPSLHTTAVNGESKTKQMSYGKKATIVDTVIYKNLNPGTNYKVTGTLMNKKTGEPIVDANGAAITSTAEFVPTKKDGTVDVTFTVDTKGLVGQSIVVFENVSLNDIDIAIHANIKDKEQTTYVMSVKTKAAASDKRSKVIDLSKKAVIVDTVTYKNLVAGETYIVTGKLMNKATGKALQKDGADYTVSKEFKPDKASGDVDIKFTVDTTELKDATLVVFEDVTTTNGTLIGQHHDINDANQSVVIKTTTKVQTGVRNFAMWVAILISIASVLLIGAFAYVRRRRRLAMIRSTRK